MRKKTALTDATENAKSTNKKKPPHILLREKYKHLLDKKGATAGTKQAEQFVAHQRAESEANQPIKSEPAQSADLTNSEQAQHLLLKVRSENGQTINAHESMLERKGVVMLGKMGQGVGTDFRAILNQQIEQGIRTYLFLTIREGWNGEYATYRCLLKRVSDTLDVSKKDLIPEYYRSSSGSIKAWFEIVSMTRLSRQEMNKIFVLSSKREIMSVITSSATIFHVGVHK